VKRVLVLLAALAAPRLAQAQVSALITASADVNNTALTIANQQGILFGTVVAGTPTTINPQTSASAGFFVIQGARRAEISVTFTLPAELRAGTGPYTIPLTFGATAACGRDRLPQGGCTLFDPATGLVDRIRNQAPPNNHYHIWLGGTISPAAGQMGGVYTATVTMTVTYTGN
jgi:spore coat protein U-like protein